MAKIANSEIRLVTRSADLDAFENAFLQLSLDAPYFSSLYTFSSREYYRIKCVTSSKTAIDRSFVLLSAGQPIFLFLGVLVHSDSTHTLCFYDLPALVYEHNLCRTRGIKRLLRDHFNSIIDNVGSIHIYDHLACHRGLSYLSELLLEIPRILCECSFRHMVNLQVSTDHLYSSLRKSYKPLVKWGIKNLDIKTYSQHNCDWEHLELLMKLHVQESGRLTRSVDSWRQQYACVRNAECFLLLAYIDDQLVSGALFNYNQNHCYYAVSVSKREMFQLPLSHALVWKGLLHAKSLGCIWFDFGITTTSTKFLLQPNMPKDVAIQFFKQGFGGTLYPEIFFQTPT